MHICLFRILESIFVMLACLPLFSYGQYRKHPSFSIPAEGKIVVKVHYSDKKLIDSSMLQFSEAELDHPERTWTSVTGGVQNDLAVYEMVSGMPIYVSLKSIFKKAREKWVLLEPGDEVTFRNENEIIKAEGRGSEKFDLMMELTKTRQRITVPPNSKDYQTESLEDYYEWDRYLSRSLTEEVAVINRYKSKLSVYAYHHMLARTADQNIDDRSDKFTSLVRGYAKKVQLDTAILCKIYDSLYYPATHDWFRMCSRYVYGNWKPLVFEVDRSFGFNYNAAPLNSSLTSNILYYEKGVEHYKGIIREMFVTDFLYKHLMRKFEFVPEIERLMDAYYFQPDFPEFKQYLKSLELRLRQIFNEEGAPAFELEDNTGRLFSKENIRGKIAVIDFWFTGCKGCMPMARVLRKVEEAYKNDSNVVFVKVSIDKDREKWLNSIREEKYTTNNGIHLYTGGKEEKHEVVKKYGVTSYPTLLIIDPYGRLTVLPKGLDPRRDSSVGLIAFIDRMLAERNDGPYVFYSADGIVNSVTLMNNVIVRKGSKIGEEISFPVQTNILGKHFEVTLKKSLVAEPSGFDKADKMLVMSDIEGNFSALRKLLQDNGVIDAEFNWTFGNGHLVLCGDLFDRGSQVTECLWLIYHLEELAKNAGGYVHFILGNHDVMNLQGDNRYTQEKYSYMSAVTNRRLPDLYGNDTELGRWIRTKNIAERIGKLLFVHAGMGIEFSTKIEPDLTEVNKLARRVLDVDLNKVEAMNPMSELITHPYGPLWYRQYYYETKAYQRGNDTSDVFVVSHPDNQQFEQILRIWNADRIIAGHTIVSDTISCHYENKLINIDTKHSEGKSEALLIDKGAYYRIDQEGKRFLLFKEKDLD